MMDYKHGHCKKNMKSWQEKEKANLIHYWFVLDGLGSTGKLLKEEHTINHAWQSDTVTLYLEHWINL